MSQDLDIDAFLAIDLKKRLIKVPGMTSGAPMQFVNVKHRSAYKKIDSVLGRTPCLR
nr:hypothetical protein [Pseudohalocynthiibacter aestuariivivens]